MKDKNKMGVMPMGRLVVSMSFPIMVSMLIQSLYNIVDSIFVAKINEAALTAAGISYSAQILQIAIAVGTGVGMNSAASRFLGAGNSQKANEAASAGLVLTVSSSLIFVLWGIFLTRPFIQMFSNDAEIVAYGTEYLRICQIFSTGIFLGTYFQRLLQATGRTFLSMLAQLAGALINLILDPLLIFGIGIFPEMGITGAALATVIGQWSAAVIGLILNLVQNREIEISLIKYKPTLESISIIYKVGVPTMLVQAFGSLMLAAMNIILIAYSSTAVAFFGVYFKLQSFLFMPMNGLGQGVLPIVGFNFGAKNFDRIKQAVKYSLIIGCILGVVGTLVFMVFAKELLILFSASEIMLEIGVPALRIISVIFAFSSATMVIGYIISGLGSGVVNMLATALRQLIILLPFACLFGKLIGLEAVWFAFWVSESIACFYAVFSLRTRLKTIKKFECGVLSK